MKVFVDDDRPAPSGWKLVRTIPEALRLLTSGDVDEISLDHDIVIHNEKGHYLGMKNFMPIVVFIVKMPKKLRPGKVTIHTANEKAGDKMMSVLKGEVSSLIRDRQYE